MVRSQDGPIPGEVVKVVHDDSNEQVENEERTDHKEGNKVGIGKVGTAACRVACILWPHVTEHVRILLAGQHDFLPGFTGGWAEQNKEGLRKGLEVVVPMDVGALLWSDFTKHLLKFWKKLKKYFWLAIQGWDSPRFKLRNISLWLAILTENSVRREKDSKAWQISVQNIQRIWILTLQFLWHFQVL